MLGGIEAGGTKFVCGVGSAPEDLTVVQVPTRSPEATMADVLAFFRQHGPVEAIGIGSFGPIDRARGRITSTPKAGWQNFEIVGALGAALGVPVAFDTDVNAAALAELQWGAGRGLTDFVYLTVGTGIGGGAVVNSRLLHGSEHPEMGHIRIPHDVLGDPFPGCCPYHGDCLEGLASGPAIQARWGVPACDLPPEHPAWALEARYLALGLVNWVCTLSPQRIIMGGGVMQQQHLFPLIRNELSCLLNGYIRSQEILEGVSTYVVPPQLGSRSGVLGALVLAEQALAA